MFAYSVKSQYNVPAQVGRPTSTRFQLKPMQCGVPLSGLQSRPF